MVEIYFDKGTLILKSSDIQKYLPLINDYIKFDPRIQQYRAKAYDYANIITILYSNNQPYKDKAKSFKPLDIKLSDNIKAYKHQRLALKAWEKYQKRGVIVLPTGSGKSYLAMMAIANVKRSTLVVVPTLDLMQQWASKIERSFNCGLGLLGGGSKEIKDITISTYDSAVLMMEFIGNRFGLIIFDECHHLPSPKNKLSASMCIAPYRLGLTATPERHDDGEKILYEIIGRLIYRQDIDEMEGSILSPYKVRRIHVTMDEDEALEYNKNYKIYKDFISENKIDFSSSNGWNQFLYSCSRQENGRDAFEAYLNQKRIARTSRAKFRKIWELINNHPGERIIIFTAENNTAYEIGRQFLLPVITHHTKVLERKEFLDNFRTGEYPVLVTSKVLNEGIDVPEASIGIIVSGSGSIREHVQRLGRILRAKKSKQAFLYELVSEGTSEYYISQRRSRHRAYKRFN